MKKKLGIGLALFVLLGMLAGAFGESNSNVAETNIIETSVTDTSITVETTSTERLVSVESISETVQSPNPTQAPILAPTQAPKQKVEDSELEIHFIDIGQGDATLLMCDGEAMLIDAGDNDKGTQVQLYLTKRNIKDLKYVIGTHPDADHIGGLDVVLYKFNTETVIMPDLSADTATYRDVVDAMKQKGIKNTLPNVGDVYELGGATFTIVAPVSTYDDRNNSSVSLLLEHGENTFLFTGDAEAEAEADITDLDISIDADVYHVGHHGSSSSSTIGFLNEVTPEYAVISCAEGNSYGHPHAEALNNLRIMGVQVFRTDEQGSITVTSDGKRLTWNCAPTDSWQSGERTGSAATQSVSQTQIVSEQSQAVEEQQQQTVTVTYVLNKNSKKFHISTCRYVGEMAEHNKLFSNDSRDTIIANKYVPCKVCNP